MIKKILLLIIIFTGFISSAFAKTSGAYLGEQVGYSAASTSELGFPLDDVSNVKNKYGFVGELHGGCLFSITKSLSLGLDIGLSSLNIHIEIKY